MQKIAIALVAMVLIAGCIGGGKTTTTTAPPATTSPATTAAPTETTLAGPVKTLELLVIHSGYNPLTLRAKVGDHVKILARTGAGMAPHNHGISIDEFGVNMAVTSEDKNNPDVIEFDATKAGEFNMDCGTCKDGIYGANHPPLIGKFIVEE